METISRELVLTFGTVGKDELKITVSKPALSIQPATIKAAMDAAVASGALGGKTAVDKVIGAQFVIKQTDSVVLA